MQAEQFANELTRHLGICAPSCRIVRQVRCLVASSSSCALTLALSSTHAKSTKLLLSPLGTLHNACHSPYKSPLTFPPAQAGATSSEWQQVVDAVSKLGGKADGLDSELAALPCFLLMQFIRGKPLLECSDAFEVRRPRASARWGCRCTRGTRELCSPGLCCCVTDQSEGLGTEQWFISGTSTLTTQGASKQGYQTSCLQSHPPFAFSAGDACASFI